MARDFSADQLTHAVDSIWEFAGAFSVHLWFEPDTTHSDFNYLLVYDDRTGAEVSSWAISLGTGWRFYIEKTTTTVHQADSGQNPSSGWHSIGGRWTGGGGNSDQSIYFDGAKTNSDRDNDNSPVYNNLNGLRVGAWKPGQFEANGSIAEIGIWNTDLSDAEFASLAAGFSPLLIRPGNLVSYWPLIGRTSPEIDLIGGRDLTLDGTVADAHPPIIYPTQPLSGFAAAVAGDPAEQNKRRSALTPLPLVIMPVPDGVISGVDKQQAAWMYSGIAATGEEPEGPPAGLRTRMLTGIGI